MAAAVCCFGSPPGWGCVTTKHCGHGEFSSWEQNINGCGIALTTANFLNDPTPTQGPNAPVPQTAKFTVGLVRESSLGPDLWNSTRPNHSSRQAGLGVVYQGTIRPEHLHVFIAPAERIKISAPSHYPLTGVRFRLLEFKICREIKP